jgi:hypothetical protein
LRQVAIEFEAALRGNSEEDIHRILSSHKDIFFSADLTISKFKLGDLFVTAQKGAWSFVPFRGARKVRQKPGLSSWMSLDRPLRASLLGKVGYIGDEFVLGSAIGDSGD